MRIVCRGGAGARKCVANAEVIAHDPEQLAVADCLISGPPCPPWASIGLRKSRADPRSDVFLAVVSWVEHHARTNPDFAFFILENVEGITKRSSAEAAPFSEEISNYLQEKLPEGWEVTLLRGNAINTGVPQSRPRIFLIGVNPLMRKTRFQRNTLDAERQILAPPPITEYLDKLPKPSDLECLTSQQDMNVRAKLAEFQQSMECTTCSVDIGVIDCARDVLKPFDNQISFNSIRTLRTNNSHLWILPSSRVQKTYGCHGRFLNIHEKSRLAGMNPTSLNMLNGDVCSLDGSGWAAQQPSARAVPLLGASCLLPTLPPRNGIMPARPSRSCCWSPCKLFAWLLGIPLAVGHANPRTCELTGGVRSLSCAVATWPQR